MRVCTRAAPVREENLVPLINVVFLLLIFFLVAGALRPFATHGVEPAATSSIEAGADPANPIVVALDGTIRVSGAVVGLDGLAGHLGALAGSVPPTLHIVADRRLPAGLMLEIVESLGAAGIRDIRLVTIHEAGA